MSLSKSGVSRPGTKLPIFLTTWRSLRFLLNHAFELFRMGWPLLLLLSIVDVFSIWVDVQGAQNSEGSFYAIAQNSFALFIVLMIITIPLIMGYLKLYFEGPDIAKKMYIRFGADEFRYLVANCFYFLALLFAFVLILGTGIVLLLLYVELSGVSFPSFEQLPDDFSKFKTAFKDPVIVIVYAVVILSILVVFLTVMVRLQLLSAVVVKEKRISLSRAFHLSQGNGWRIILVLIFVFLLCESITFGSTETISFIFNTDFPYPVVFTTIDDFPLEDLNEVTILAVYSFFYNFFLFGLSVGFVGAAYEYLVAHEGEEEA